MKDTSAYSASMKKRWESKTKEERTAHAKKMALSKHKNSTYEQRRAHAMKMVQARKDKGLKDKL